MSDKARCMMPPPSTLALPPSNSTTLRFGITLRAVTLWKHKTTPSSLAPALPSLRAHAVTSASTIPDCAQQKERSTNGTSSSAPHPHDRFFLETSHCEHSWHALEREQRSR
eukprot:36616-Rhodomonas_salina.1